MASTFKFELVSPERILLSEEAEQVVLPGSEGDFAVLAGHAPVISTLRPGVLDVTLPGATKQRIFVTGGFAEVLPEGLTVLAQHATDVAEMSADRIAGDLEAAEAELASAKDDEGRRMAAALVDELKRLKRA